jgi:hypothetical protein
MTYNSLMKEFTVYKHPKKEKYEAIKIGFAWFPFLIALSCNTFLMIPLLFFFDYILIPSVLLQTVWIVGPFWLMERKLILLSLPFYLYSIHYNFVFWKDIRIELLDGRIGLPLVLALIYFLIWLLVGFKGNEWSHKKLKKKGYPIIKTIKARTRKSAIALAKNLKEDKGKEYQEVVSGNKDCPMCAETVKAKAKICRYCNYEFE